MKLTLDIAKSLLTEAERVSKGMGLSEDIAIVDDGGNLIAFHRMDGARLAGISIAVDKAWTAISLKLPTSTLAQNASPGGAQYGINTTNQGRIVILGGGLPLVRDNYYFGAVGVSGSTSANDEIVAQAAVNLFNNIPYAHFTRF